MKKILFTLFLLALFIGLKFNVNAQCISSSFVGSYSANGASFSQQLIYSCNQTDDYVVVTVPAGIWRFETSITTDFITITDLGNTPIDTGTSSVLVGFLTAQSVRMHIAADDQCTVNFNCRDSYVTQELTPVPQISANDTFICDGFGPVTLTASNLFGDQTYWYTGSCGSTPIDSGASITVPISSTTTYFAANFFNSSISACGSLTVNIVSNPTITFTSVQDVLCFGDSTGAITASSSTGTAPFTYSWSNGMIGAMIDTLDTGNYSVTVTDIYGCVGQGSTLIDQPTALTASTNVLTVPACAGQATGSIQVTPNGGFGSYSYLWSNSDTNAIADSLDAGPHQVTITDDNGCQLVSTDTIVAPEVVMVSLVSIVDSVLCFDDETGEIVLTANGGSGQLSFLWSNASTDTLISGIGAGVYSATVTDQNGCNAVFTDTVYEPDQLTVFMSIADATCNDSGDGMLEAQANGGTSPFDYAWSNTQTTFQISSLDTGVYTVTVTDNNDCQAIASETVGFINPDPIIPLDSAYVLCPESEIILDADNAGSMFNWSTGESTQTITATSIGFYSVEVTDINGCSSEATTEVYDCLGLDEFSLNGSIDVYPNPTNGNVNMTFDMQELQRIEYTLFTIDGRPIIKRQVNLTNGKANTELSLSSFSSGVYFITFESEGKSQTQRIILQ